MYLSVKLTPWVGFGEIFSVLGSGCAKLRNVASSVIAEVDVIVQTVCA